MADVSNIGNSLSFTRLSAPAPTEGSGNRTGATGASDISQDISTTQIEGQVNQPPTPTAELGPEDNTVQSHGNSLSDEIVQSNKQTPGSQLDLTA